MARLYKRVASGAAAVVVPHQGGRPLDCFSGRAGQIAAEADGATVLFGHRDREGELRALARSRPRCAP